ncbi:DUF4113 domain-containing protein [Desulfonatronum thiodismutans]|uniref:DUF4113 domain-containing protein n=1 Tax=Desulfonatronum thiodismutans TaxID=159290 RepID=UPI001267B8B1|nr:DUF4113 domain-containing protein [Desulfonatronum thiodismutans]
MTLHGSIGGRTWAGDVGGSACCVLFEPSPEDRARSMALMDVMDRVNAKWGAMTMRVAAEGTGQRWVMRQAHLSPKYTTDWKALPKVL